MCNSPCNIIIITTYWKGAGGGISVYNYNLYKSLRDQGCRVVVLYVNGVGNCECSHKLSSNPLILPWQILKHINKFRSLYGDECLILVNGGWPYIAAALLGKNTRGKLFYIFHTHADRRYRGISNMLFKFLLSKVDGALFVSRGLKRNLEDVGGLRISTKWSVLYGAPSVRVPTQTEMEEFKRRFKISGKKFYLLGLGLTALKAKAEGAKLLMRALKELPNDVHLVLTRKGRFIMELQEFVKSLGLCNRVIFTGDLENPHVATYISDVYTHISWGEGLPLALLEVMAIGKPIIASRVTGIPEAIRHPLEGILINNTEEEIVNAVKLLRENPKLRKKMSIISKRAVNRRFSWKKTARKLLLLIRQ